MVFILLPFLCLRIGSNIPTSLLIRVFESVFLFFFTHPTKGLSAVDLSKKYLLVLLIFSIIFLFSVSLCSNGYCFLPPIALGLACSFQVPCWFEIFLLCHVLIAVYFSLSTASLASPKLWCFVFSFSFVSQYFLNSLVIFFFCDPLIRSVLFNFHESVNFSCVTDFWLDPLWSEKTLGMVSIF